MNIDETSTPYLTALVLAASRQGFDDPVAKLQNKSHKCLVMIDGVAMIERVVQTLIDCSCFKRILISIEEKQILSELASTRGWLEMGVIEVVPSAENLADTLINLSNNSQHLSPLVITTADNALHTQELVHKFVSDFSKGTGDVAIAVTQESTVLSDYPDAGLSFFQFKDGGYSFCNLYGIRSAKGFNAANIFRSGGQFRKRPWRIIKVFGILPLIQYKWRLLTLSRGFDLIAGKLGLTIDKVLLPYSYGPIDVDNQKSFTISEHTLKKRRDIK